MAHSTHVRWAGHLMGSVVYKVLVEGKVDLPFFQVLGITVRDERDLDPSAMEIRIRYWMLDRGEQFLGIDPDETARLDEEHVPEAIRSGAAEIAPVSGRIFHPEKRVGYVAASCALVVVILSVSER